VRAWLSMSYGVPVITTLRITGMTCNHCVHSVGAALRTVAGVSAVDVDLAGGSARVTHVETATIAQLVEAVTAAGYSAR
jgi:copper chaperone